MVRYSEQFHDHKLPFGWFRIEQDRACIVSTKFLKRKPQTPYSGSHPSLLEAAKQLEEYVRGTRTEFDLALNPKGTPFQQMVWKFLGTLKFGDFVSYDDEARALGNSNKARAVGGANGKNPIPIFIPCHRVGLKGGGLGGYSGGIAIKKELLRIEGHMV